MYVPNVNLVVGSMWKMWPSEWSDGHIFHIIGMDLSEIMLEVLLKGYVSYKILFLKLI